MKIIQKPPWWWYIDVKNDPLGYIRAYLNEAKHFLQRGYRGYSDSDHWNADSYISYQIVHACRSLRASKKGIPSKYKTWREWDRVLAQIQKGFSLYNKFHNELGNPTDKKYKKQLHMSFKLLEENFESLWD